MFYATPGERAPEQLIRVFCGDGEGAIETALALGVVVDQLRDALWLERQGEAEDVAKIQAVEAAGEMDKAYNMRSAQGLYAASVFQQMRGLLFTKLDFGLNDLKTLRQEKVDAGTFVAATDVQYARKQRDHPTGKGGSARKGKGPGGGKGHQDTAAPAATVKKASTKDAAAEKAAAVATSKAAPAVAAAKAKLALDTAKDIKEAVGGSAAEVMAESSQTASAN